MFFIFDTETNGLVNCDYPGIISIGWMVLGSDLKKVESGYYLINRGDIPSYHWNSFAESVHGITRSKSMKHGADLQQCLMLIKSKIDSCKYVCAHNAKFDTWHLNYEFKKARIPEINKETICTMKEARRIWKGESAKLDNVLAKCYPSAKIKHHQADEDARGCGLILHYMLKNGMINRIKQGEIF